MLVWRLLTFQMTFNYWVAQSHFPIKSVFPLYFAFVFFFQQKFVTDIQTVGELHFKNKEINNKKKEKRNVCFGTLDAGQTWGRLTLYQTLSSIGRLVQCWGLRWTSSVRWCPYRSSQTAPGSHTSLWWCWTFSGANTGVRNQICDIHTLYAFFFLL